MSARESNPTECGCAEDASPDACSKPTGAAELTAEVAETANKDKPPFVVYSPASAFSAVDVPRQSDRRRLHAPRENRSVFADPPLSEVAAAIDANRADTAPKGYDCQGRSLAQLRQQTRAQAVRQAEHCTVQWRDIERFPVDSGDVSLIAAGHQPELFHPGVWAKNFALDCLARRYGAAALHLVVDNDTIKTTTLRVPTGAPTQPDIARLPFDTWQSERPWEELEISDRALFEGFGREVERAMAGYPFEPLIRGFWPEVVEQSRRTPRLAECITAARNRLEHRWGARNLELPLSRLCRLEGFHWFASHLLAQLPRFRTVHNEALADYRRRNHIRSLNHPVPALAEDDGWNEAPFWVWKGGEGRRRRLFARQRGGEVLLSDGHEQLAVLPLKPDGEACCAAEVLSQLPVRGIKLRTRALTTTLFSRLILSDLFIHGIGGAKYDELADAIIRRFFGFEPPTFLTLSATVHLPVKPFAERPEDLRRLDRLERDLVYHPDRHLDGEAAARDDVQALVAQKRAAIARQPTFPTERRERFREIRALNVALAPWVTPEREALQGDRRLVEGRLRANRILTSREFAFCLYPEQLLREFYAAICA